MSSERPVALPDCRGCRHYYVTHEVRFPHGCHAMGFRSALWPAQEVLNASGQPCLRHQPRGPKSGRAGGGEGAP